MCNIFQLTAHFVIKYAVINAIKNKKNKNGTRCEGCFWKFEPIVIKAKSYPLYKE